MRVIIDGKECEAGYGEYILDVARRNGIHIPTLCHSGALPGQGSCRLCIVEVAEAGKKKVVVSCLYPITGEIEVTTNSERIYRMRRNIVRLLAARAPSGEFIKKLREEYGIPEETRFKVDEKEKCILCGLCVRACEEIGLSAISTVNRGTTKKVAPPFEEPPEDCIGCASCAYVCPTGAIEVQEFEGKRVIWNRAFELLKCAGCGRYFITRQQYEYIKNKHGIDMKEPLCDRCRQKSTAEKLIHLL
ncbi:2Fe-2S iron-sulfur cluster-binding protein [Thermosediminibacter litoriperuensis]|uniref:Ferredoxin n=1 Tax=Thermosediminibacter litoriperuensis TaxID=291989 RepID=A0A5S5AFX5_9FIRM|nr:2Fe-2S iron-sulfur cluster-binding protein [Thermosediminibacter litoriperuensis]TYP47444.1 4Fe-4S dicluster protein [Thermosediminibacter litoriperuensis]